ncbi:hypothetical protein AAHE18_03G226600 [Arachis hypogaea]
MLVMLLLLLHQHHQRFRSLPIRIYLRRNSTESEKRCVTERDLNQNQLHKKESSDEPWCFTNMCETLTSAPSPPWLLPQYDIFFVLFKSGLCFSLCSPPPPETSSSSDRSQTCPQF